MILTVGKFKDGLREMDSTGKVLIEGLRLESTEWGLVSFNHS